MRTGSTGSKTLKRILPGPVYCDTSALVKLYLPESDSALLNRLVEGRRDLIISDLAITEIVSSLCRRQREGSLDRRTVTRLHQMVLGHLNSGIYRRVELLPATSREAERLLMSLGNVSLRASDALHLALAISGGAQSVLTYDRRLSEAARTCGIEVYP